MNILLTGGSGLIGLAFVNRFEEHQFTLLTRSPEQAKHRLPASVCLIDSLAQLTSLNDFDAVINLAGEPIIDKRWGVAQKEKICDSRWRTTQQLVDLFACSQSPPHTFLSGSAVGVYGNRGDEPLTETSAVSVRDFATSLCLRWEAIAKQAQPYTRVVLLRTGVVLAADGGALNKMLLPFKCGLGGRIGNGQQFMPWIHIQDHLSAMQFLLENTRIAGPVNLVAPEAERNREFTRALASALHRFALLPVPAFVLNIALGESSALLLDSQKVVPQVLLDAEFTFGFSNLKQTLVNLLKAPTERNEET